MRSKGEIIAELAQTVFLVFGALCLLFSGYVLTNNTGLSAILLIVGMLSIIIRIKYNEEEAVTE